MNTVKTQERLLTVLLKPVISEKATLVADKNTSPAEADSPTVESGPV